jgi:hypothetical protein
MCSYCAPVITESAAQSADSVCKCLNTYTVAQGVAIVALDLYIFILPLLTNLPPTSFPSQENCGAYGLYDRFNVSVKSNRRGIATKRILGASLPASAPWCFALC